MNNNIHHFYQLLALCSTLPLFCCLGLGFMHLISKMTKAGSTPLTGSFVAMWFGMFLGMLASAALAFISEGVFNG